jgi:formylglycine-generating enzyme required for sulfatase activity
VRLPTEAEWEYACRAGTVTAYNTGDTEADLDQAAWYRANSKRTTHPVGQKKPNAWGLYDMHGNVWQWCQDWYGYEGYQEGAAVDPQGPDTGIVRVLRGGSWIPDPEFCRAANRSYYQPGIRNNDIGYRVVVLVARIP